jgi:uncharacterized protein (DUF433 family)
MGVPIVTYVQKTAEGGWRVAGSRVSLDSIVHAYWEGRLPEAIATDFPSLSLERIHGAIAYFLGHRDDVDAHLRKQGQRWEDFRAESEDRHAGVLRRMRTSSGTSHEGSR